MKYFIFILSFSFLQDVPLKPKEEFEIKLDYSFKQRPVGDHNTVNLTDAPNGYKQRTSAAVLPYLILHVKILALREEKMRMRISTNRDNRATVKRVSAGVNVVLDLGFTADMIDRVTAHEYTLAFISADKRVVDQILISVDDDGSFLVNGEKRGKF
jgi:hypothetical protein